MFEVGEKVRVRDVDTLLMYDDVDLAPSVDDEMFGMCGRCYRIVTIDEWTGNLYLDGWWFSPDMVEKVDPITNPEEFMNIIKSKVDEDGEISLFELALTVEEDL